MNKGELIEALASETGESKAAAARFLDSFISLTTAQLKKGNDISIPGFGSLKVAKRAARTGRNPATGDTIKIAASKVVRFSAGATLKNTLNPKRAK